MYDNWRLMIGKKIGDRPFGAFADVHPYRLHNKNVKSSPIVKLLRLLNKELDKYSLETENKDWYENELIKTAELEYAPKVDVLKNILKIDSISDLDDMVELDVVKVQEAYQMYVDLFGKGYVLDSLSGIASETSSSLGDINSRLDVLEFVLGFDISNSYRPNIDGDLEG